MLSSCFNRRNWLVWSCAFAFSGICPAATLTFAQIQESVLAPGHLSDIYDSGQLNQTLLTHQLGVFSTGGFATSTGTINGNDISGMVSTQNGQARMDAFWSDAFTVSGLPLGTPVEILITNSLTSHVSLTGGPGSAGAISDLRLFLSNPLDLILSNTESNVVNGTQTISHMVTLISGATAPFIIDEHLTLNAVVNLTGSAEADAPNDIFITVLTAGAVLHSASGVDYSQTTATPEPATVVPVLMGLVGMAIRRMRRTALR
ncbi:MAG TPA: hypothetical protein VNX18_09310 [Bryobacteraceae bacterium]|nr:hypothetical protein [Bryobacteraceae bacterium]